MKKILLVDDEQNVLNSLRRELKEYYDIESCDSPLAALELGRNARFDLVIADYKMPDMNGIEFLQQFGQMQPDASRMVLSGNTDIGTLIRMINETHIYRFLKKPWERAELLSSILQALDYRDAVLESRRAAAAGRGYPAAAQTHKKDDSFCIVLVERDDHLRKLMARELADDSRHASLNNIVRQELHQERPARESKWIVKHFQHAEAALSYMREHDCDLVISAQTLPDMEGVELLGKASGIHPDAALILLSSNTDDPALSVRFNGEPGRSPALLYWESRELRSDARRQAWNLHRLKTSAIQVLNSRKPGQ